MAASNARIVSFNRGGRILDYQGFRYTRRSNNHGLTKIYWRCLERKPCNGTATTNYNVQNGIFILPGKPQTHEPDNIDIRVQEVVRSIKRKDTEHPNAPPASIFRGEVSTINSQAPTMYHANSLVDASYL